MVTLGLVGCGTIGSQLAHDVQSHFRGTARLIGIYDHNLEAAKRLSRRLRHPVPIQPPEHIIQRCQFLIEAASVSAVGQLLPLVIRHRKSLLIMSTGGILQHRKLLLKAMASKIPIYVPSGALVGLDGIKAGAIGKLRSVTLTTRKPPKAFSGAPGILRRKIHLSSLRSERLLFQGSAARAIVEFPQNINVAATLALAGIGSQRTRVRLVADPAARHNTHEVEAIGSFGRFTARTENRPSSENPKTSQLAVLSAIATLRQIFQPLHIGT